MAQEFNRNKKIFFNKIVERPVDVFYSGKIEIISLSFKNFPEINCNNNELWEVFLKNTWDQQFHTTDDILNFLRHCVYRTGLAGRFYKINCILPLDNVYSLLKAKLPSTDISFKVWRKLHELARLVLKENYEKTALNISLVLDVHVIPNSECDNSGNKIEFLNSTDASKDERHILIYHITICYDNNDECILTDSENRPNFDLQSKSNDNTEVFGGKFEIFNPSEHTAYPNQLDAVLNYPTNSTNLNQWEKYGARPKDKQFFKKNCSGATEHRKKYVETSSVKNLDRQDKIERKLKQSVSVNTENHSILSEGFIIPTTLDFRSGKNEEYRQTFKESNGQSLPPNSVVSNLTEFSPALNNEKNDVHFINMSLISIPSASPEVTPIKSNSFVPDRCFPEPSEDKRCQEKYGARPKELQTHLKLDFCENLKYFETTRKKVDLHENLIAEKNEFSDNSELSSPHPTVRRRITKFSERSERRDRINRYKELELTRSLQSGYNQDNIYIDADSFMNKDDHTFRENIFRYRVKKFFENYTFSDAYSNDKSSLTAIDRVDLVKEFKNILPIPDYQTNLVQFADSNNSFLGIADVSSQTPSLNSDVQNSGHLAIKNFEEVKHFDRKNAFKK